MSALRKTAEDDCYTRAANEDYINGGPRTRTKYTYDQLNRVSSAAYAIGGSTDQTGSFTYDTGTNGKGHLTGASDANHSLAWSYDALGRVTGMGQTVTGVTKSVGYGYTNGDLTTLTTPSGQTITYAYSDHQITGITVNSTALLTNAVYEPFGPVRGWTWGNSTTEVRLHNTDGNPSQLSSVEASTLGYDAGYRITSVNNSTNTALSWTLGYDALDRTTSASQTGTSQGFGYDADGNRLNQTGAGTPSAPWTAGASFNYNGRGRMSSVSAGATTYYIYNALGQLIEKSGATTTLLMYDLSGHLIGEYTGAGTLIQETVWLNDLPVATLRPNGSGISIYYVHADQLGAPRLVTRPADNVIMWRWDTYPFGTITPNQNPASQGVFVYNLRFPGQYYQAETGLNYNYFRDYDPGSGRYIECDPIGLAGGINSYAYAAGNPVSRRDPTGLASMWDGVNPATAQGLALQQLQNYAASLITWVVGAGGSFAIGAGPSSSSLSVDASSGLYRNTATGEYGGFTSSGGNACSAQTGGAGFSLGGYFGAVYGTPSDGLAGPFVNDTFNIPYTNFSVTAYYSSGQLVGGVVGYGLGAGVTQTISTTQLYPSFGLH